MNWQAIGAVGEILGALAVVLTLAYLAVQIRESRKATAADIYQTRAMSRADAELRIALNSPNYHEIHFRFHSALASQGVEVALASLSDQERFLLGRYYDALMVRMDNVCFQYDWGFIPESYFEDIKQGLRQFAPVWASLGLVATGKLDRVIREVVER
jgi:hypothetical protein